MKTPLVTYESVVAAIQALQAEGKHCSVRAITRYIGGGSPNAILKHIREWEAGRPLIATKTLDLDQSIIDSIRRQITRVAESALQEQQKRVAGLEENLKTLSEALDDAEEQNKKLEQQVNETQQTLQACEQRSVHAQQQIEALQRQVDAERQRGDRLAQELAQAQVHLESRAQLQATLEAEQNLRKEAERIALTANAQVEILQQNLSDLKAWFEHALQRQSSRDIGK